MVEVIASLGRIEVEGEVAKEAMPEEEESKPFGKRSFMIAFGEEAAADTESLSLSLSIQGSAKGKAEEVSNPIGIGLGNRKCPG